ncbi:hypothetical protein N7510_010018 [Penicillium lagena]|uniref:uncharacterized protein n=1 Tax=Penicillium lagena TaxID=94218 RepID=UPI002541A11F|nr:uncharacterized protein N7510_010018 [Penicillium lagena]KAJ5604864.1 hypothetical protein N7510_010018 [Penicillium lagena]
MFSSPPFSFLLLLLPAFLSSVRADVTVEASNSTNDIPSARFHLHSHVSLLNNQKLAPLTAALTTLSDAQLQSFNLTGPTVVANPINSFSLPNSSIACISCDQSEYVSGFVTASGTISDVISAGNALAILLYSESAGHCDYSSDENFANVFTVLNPDAAKALLNSTGSSLSILSAMSTAYIPTGTPDPVPGQQNNDSPNTAMIILYSITGIITALFLGIIITGAVRAHRHPERYGPRRIAGRVRQSRARGIARAMLETIPIVKFGDNADSVEAAKRDVELTMNPEETPREHFTPRTDSITAVEMSAPGETQPSPPEQASDDPQTTTAHESKPDAVPDTGNFSCPICTDDFIKGQDLRVLPCNHQFHMECIDPWLVNVSGTCPLCRIDLNPPPAEENAEPGEGETGENTNTEATPDGTATPTADTTHHHPHRRLTTLLHGHSPLNARHMHEATVEERLAALRRVREENQGQGQGQVEGSRRSRSRLTTRLRDRFRIRTRAHGVEGSSGVQTPAEPAVPGPTQPTPAAEPET